MSLTLQENDRRLDSPPLQGSGRGWGLSANSIAELQARATQMRRNPTEPEKRLSGSRLSGYKFRRQAVLPPFIADFLCPSAGLVIEVDGDTHDRDRDVQRDHMLAARGCRTLRFMNADVIGNIEGVADLIVRALSEASARGERPHPNPSPEGEGLRG